jgi:hypothetical protein
MSTRFNHDKINHIADLCLQEYFVNGPGKLAKQE